MKIAIYDYLRPLFGRLCRSWQQHLHDKGYEVSLYQTINFGDRPIPAEPDADVHLLFDGVFFLRSLQTHGFPKKGATMLWLCEPLVDDPLCSHHWKAEIVNAIGSKFAAVAGMDQGIVSYLKSHFPDVPTSEIPYVIDRSDIADPIPETARRIDVLQLGRTCERRRNVETLFAQEQVPATFIYGGLYGDDRYNRIAEARVSINLHRDERSPYFGQHRVFEAWAAGSVVVSEPCGPLEPLGVEDGKHLVIAEISEMPRVCRELLGDVRKRQAIVSAAQELLRERYTTDRWVGAMSAMIESPRG